MRRSEYLFIYLLVLPAYHFISHVYCFGLSHSIITFLEMEKNYPILFNMNYFTQVMKWDGDSTSFAFHFLSFGSR